MVEAPQAQGARRPPDSYGSATLGCPTRLHPRARP